MSMEVQVFDNETTLKRVVRNNVKTFSNGDKIKISSNNSFYEYQDGKFIKIKDNNIIGAISLYELNKQIISEFTPYDSKKIKEKKKELTKYIESNDKNKYFMLLGKEISYYTLFSKRNKGKDFATALIDCLINIGDILDISEQYESNGKNIEIWVKLKDKDEVTCLFLFPYDEGVVNFA